MQEIKLGVIGFGGRGGYVGHQTEMVTGGLVKITAVVEISKEKYNAACKEYGIKPRLYESVRSMLNKETLDAVIIGTPNCFHLANLKDFDGLTMPIFLEKPLDSTFEKICDVMRFAGRYRGPILVGHCMRYAPILRKAKELITGGVIGKICSTRFVQNCHYGNLGYHNWRRNREKSGTWFLEKATHDFDIMNWLIEANPVSVMAVSRLQVYGGDKPNNLRCSECAERLTCPEDYQTILHRWGANIIDEATRREDFCVFAKETDTPDNEVCLVQFDNGLFGTYQECFFTPRSYHHRVYEVMGTLGAMEVDLGEYEGNILVCNRLGSYKDSITYHFDYLGRNHYNGDGAMTKHFYNICCGNEKPHSTVAQAFMAEVLGYAAVISTEKNAHIKTRDLVPKDLQNVFSAIGIFT